MNPAVPVINIFINFGGWRLVDGGWIFSREFIKFVKFESS